MSQLVKIVDVPKNLQKGGICPYRVEIYSDHVSCYGCNEGPWFFKDFTGVSTQAATVFCAFAGVVFLNSVSGQYSLKTGSAVLQDRNRINFCSGTFSYAAANSFVAALADDIRKAIEFYKSNPDAGSNTMTVQSTPADELKKFKELLDIGAITQDEFDTKKKEILGF